MEALASPLRFVMELKIGIENGDSVRCLIFDYINKTNGEDFTFELSDFILRFDNDQSIFEFMETKKIYRKPLYMILERGLRGEPILARLIDLKSEYIEFSNMEIEKYMALLPFYSLIPLLLFEFPAFLILLFGPILGDFNRSISL